MLLIFGLLADHPVQLYLCSLVCRAWYFGSGGDLDWSTSVQIESEGNLRRLAHIITSPNNFRYGRLVKWMSVVDDAAKPFAHSLPIRLPGNRLPNLQHLELINLNWSATRPHPVFFPCFSRFPNLTIVELAWCQFRRPDDLWNMIAASTNLRELRLRAISVQFDWFGSHAPAPDRKRQLSALTVGEPYPPPVPPALSGASLIKKYGQRIPLVLPGSIVDVLSLQSTLTRLSLRLNRFSSFGHLDRLLGALPMLMDVEASHNPSWEFPRALRTSGHLTRPMGAQNARAWVHVTLSRMSSNTARCFLTSLSPAERSHDVQKLSITLNESPSLGLGLVVSEILGCSGGTLKDFGWQPGVAAASVEADVSESPSLFARAWTSLMTTRSMSRLSSPRSPATSLCSGYTLGSFFPPRTLHYGRTRCSWRCYAASQAHSCSRFLSTSTCRTNLLPNRGLGP